MYKPIKIIPIIFLITTAFLYASTFDLLSSYFILNIPDTSDMNKSALNYHVDHNEIFRSSLNDSLLSRYTLREQNASFTHSGNNCSLNLGWSRKVYRLSDIFDSDYSTADFLPVSYSFKVKIQSHINDWLIQPGLNYSFSRSSDTLFITEFPVSEQSAYNTYFFNLLPQTFGDTIPYSNSSDAFSADILVHKNKGDQSFLFYLKYLGFFNKLMESHINTSNNNLNGPRESICRFNYSGIKGSAVWTINKHSAVWMGVSYTFSPLKWDHTVFPDQPDTLEIIKISEGNTHALNVHAGYQLLSAPFALSASVAGGFINNHTHISTPVLGYIFRILPISHQAEAELSSNYLLTHIHFDHPFSTSGFSFTPRADIIAGRFWSDISIQALLQFGLEDIDIEESYIHAVYIGSLGFSGKVAINRDLFFTFEADQLIPYVKTVSPVTPPPPPDNIKRYGGLSIKLGVSMNW